MAILCSNLIGKRLNGDCARADIMLYLREIEREERAKTLNALPLLRCIGWCVCRIFVALLEQLKGNCAAADDDVYCNATLITYEFCCIWKWLGFFLQIFFLSLFFLYKHTHRCCVLIRKVKCIYPTIFLCWFWFFSFFADCVCAALLLHHKTTANITRATITQNTHPLRTHTIMI